MQTQFDLILGPGSTLTGEMLWDYTQLKGPKLIIKLATNFSTSEVLLHDNQEKFEQDEQAGDEALNRLRDTVAEEHKGQLDEKDREMLRI